MNQSAPDLPKGLTQALSAMLGRLPQAAPGHQLHIVDAGAHKGRTALAMVQARSDVAVTAIEANPHLAARLRKRLSGQPRIHIKELALGERAGRATLQVLPSTSLSSLLAPSGLARKYPERDLTPERLVEVVVQRLDDVVDAPVDALKLDVQGFELHVLKGASRVLGQAKALVVELAFVQMYEGAPLAQEVIDFLDAFGFRPHGYFDERRDDDNRLLSADALFVRPVENTP